MASALRSVANTLQSVLNSVIEGINSALAAIPGFGDHANISTITTNPSSLSNVSLPNFWSGPLNDLNNTLPTFALPYQT